MSVMCDECLLLQNEVTCIGVFGTLFLNIRFT